MKRILTLCSIIIVCFDILAQTTQNGLTLSYNESNKKTPLGGVQIVIRDAGSTISNANGSFTLKFNTSKPGDKVTYREISKNGYEIFNNEALEQWNISSHNKPFVIILCKSSLFKKLKDKYNQVASASYAEQYKKEKQIVQKQLKEGKLKEEEYKRKILQLEDNYYKQLSNLNSYIDKFARIDLSELNDTEKTIIDYVQKGEIEKAISIYESQDYLLKYKQETKKITDINDAERKLRQLSEELASDREVLLKSIQNQVMVYKLAGGYDNMQKAKHLLVDVVNADTTNCASSLMLADFLYEQQNFEDAFLYYQLGGRHANDNEKLIKIFLRMGQIVSQSATTKGKIFDFALGILNYAGKLFNELPESKIIANVKLKLDYYYSVGRLYLNVRDYEHARSYYSGIKRFYEEEESMYDLYEINNCSIVLAGIYQNTNRLDQSDSLLNVCIPQIEKLYNDNKKETVELYAESLRLKGGNMLLKGDDVSWLNYSQKEIEILEEMDVENTKGVLYTLADVYDRIACHYEISKDTSKATTYHKKAYQTLKRDKTFSFIANGVDRYRILKSIIFHLMDIKDFDYVLSIIEHEQKLTDNFDFLDAFKAEIMYNSNNIEEAILLFSDVVRNKKTVYTSEGYLQLNQRLKEHLNTLYNDNRIYSDEETAILLLYYYGYKYLNEKLYEKAIPFLKELVLFGEERVSLKVLQETLYNIGEIYIENGDKDKDYDIALDYTKKSYEKGFEQALNNIAWILYLKGKYVEALPYAEEAVKKYPNSANFLDTLASILASLNRKKEAIDIYKKCIDILQKENRIEEARNKQIIVDSLMK